MSSEIAPGLERCRTGPVAFSRSICVEGHRPDNATSLSMTDVARELASGPAMGCQFCFRSPPCFSRPYPQSWSSAQPRVKACTGVGVLLPRDRLAILALDSPLQGGLGDRGQCLACRIAALGRCLTFL